MKQLTQVYRTGAIQVADVPAPTLGEGRVLVRTHYSLISAGTERATVNVARDNLVGKARQRPDLVKKVLQTSQKVGVKKTFDIVRNRLNTPQAMGYSLAGEVLAVGGDGPDFLPGTAVACAGVGYASHAEIVSVPKLLCVSVPDGVGMDDAAYGTLGAIALHGVRQADVKLGETVGVIGLGLVGQLTARILRAAGCRVIGIDLAEFPVKLAEKTGVMAFMRQDPQLENKIESLTQGYGLDAVLITAATSSTDPFDLALELLRDRGRVVIVGGVKIDIPKSLHSHLFRKEIEIFNSRSYGPGRYDPAYEEHGHDYPYGYVRWTENRNIAAFLQLIAEGQLSVKDLTTHRFGVDDAVQAYDLITGETVGETPPIGVLLRYDVPAVTIPASQNGQGAAVPVKAATGNQQTIGLGVIGVGNFGKVNILPHLQADARAELVGVTTARGFTAAHAADQFGFQRVGADVDDLLADEKIGAVYILTRHDSHAELVCRALKTGRAVYVEKPLALDHEELTAVTQAYRQANKPLFVGYNRRYAPTAVTLREKLGDGGGPLGIIYRINAGPLPPDSWYLDAKQGGRFIGEGGHFIDFCRYLVGKPIAWIHAVAAPVPGRSPVQQDTLSVQVSFVDGSWATILYVSSGDPGLEKEQVELFGRGISAVLSDFRTLTIHRAGKKEVLGEGGLLGKVQDKGYEAEQAACLATMTGYREAPIPWPELVETSLATFAAIDSLRTGQRVAVDAAHFLANVEA